LLNLADLRTGEVATSVLTSQRRFIVFQQEEGMMGLFKEKTWAMSKNRTVVLIQHTRHAHNLAMFWEKRGKNAVVKIAPGSLYISATPPAEEARSRFDTSENISAADLLRRRLRGVRLKVIVVSGGKVDEYESMQLTSLVGGDARIFLRLRPVH
jgi:hypothetical protein